MAEGLGLQHDMAEGLGQADQLRRSARRFFPQAPELRRPARRLFPQAPEGKDVGRSDQHMHTFSRGASQLLEHANCS
jgi:hypothetical protein